MGTTASCLPQEPETSAWIEIEEVLRRSDLRLACRVPLEIMNVKYMQGQFQNKYVLPPTFLPSWVQGGDVSDAQARLEAPDRWSIHYVRPAPPIPGTVTPGPPPGPSPEPAPEPEPGPPPEPESPDPATTAIAPLRPSSASPVNT